MMHLPTPALRRLLTSFFKRSPTTAIYTLSLHDALPISARIRALAAEHQVYLLFGNDDREVLDGKRSRDRKSTRLNSSHSQISYAAFCLKKKTRSARGLCLRRSRLCDGPRRPPRWACSRT